MGFKDLNKKEKGWLILIVVILLLLFISIIPGLSHPSIDGYWSGENSNIAFHDYGECVLFKTLATGEAEIYGSYVVSDDGNSITFYWVDGGLNIAKPNYLKRDGKYLVDNYNNKWAKQ